MSDLAELGREALAALRVGDVGSATRGLSQLEEDSGNVASAWAGAVRAAWWHADPQRGALPTTQPGGPPPEPEAREPWALARLSEARAAHLRLDPVGARAPLRAATEWAGALGGAVGELVRVELEFAALLEHGALDASDEVCSDPDARLDSTVWRALALGEADRVEEAVGIARRASRMARTEGAPQREYLANLALARLRRIDGHPHLAIRILSAITRVAPTPWHEWLRWELALAGAPELAPPAASGTSPSVRLASWLDALRRGEVGAFDRALEALRSAAEGLAFLRSDVETLAAVVDPRHPIDSLPPAVAAWARGRAPLPPRGLFNLGVAAKTTEERPIACALGTLEGSRRILGCSLPFAGVPASRVFPASGRVEGLVAALLIAGPDGLDEKALFETVYGFRFRPTTHSGALRVGLHRARKSIDGISIDRDRELLRLHVSAPLAVADPRCVRSIHDRVLDLVAQHKSATARDIAQLLAIPLRNAQRALASLTDEGFCGRVGRGPATAYVVEDTTFSEPTRSDVWKPVR